MHLFLDLDRTVVSLDQQGKYHAGGDFYSPLHGLTEFLRALGEIPGMSVNFFSFGPHSRNSDLVSQLLDDVVELSGGELPLGLQSCRVFSQNHLNQVDGFTVLKRLEELPTACKVDLQQTIMVDDMASFVCFEGEESNFLPVYSGEFQFTGPGSVYPSGVFKARRENSLIRVLGMILWCVANKNVSLVDALTALQWDLTSRTYRHRETNCEKIYTQGLAALQRFNPKLDIVDSERRGFRPWSPPLAKLNPGADTRVLSWYQHFSFDEQQVMRIVHRGGSLNFATKGEDSSGEVSKSSINTVEIFEGLSVNLYRELSGEATKDVVRDLVSYSLEADGNLKLVCIAPGKYKSELKVLRLCDFDG